MDSKGPLIPCDHGKSGNSKIMESQSLTKTGLKDTPIGGFGNHIEGKKLQTASSKGPIVLLETHDMTTETGSALIAIHSGLKRLATFYRVN